MTRIIIHGATGRMGSRLCQIAHDDPSFQLVGAVASADDPRLGQHAAQESSTQGSSIQIAQSIDVLADVVVDFSSDNGAQNALAIARNSHAALLVGTTALSEQTRSLLQDESDQRAVLIAPNTSMGVALLTALVQTAAKVLKKNFDFSIVEAHHRHKLDAPSGTALRLATAAEAAGAQVEPAQVVSIRGGEVIGEHTVRFAGQHEYIQLSHTATSRDLFVHGALHAAQWLNKQPAGIWKMEDVLGFDAS